MYSRITETNLESDFLKEKLNILKSKVSSLESEARVKPVKKKSVNQSGQFLNILSPLLVIVTVTMLLMTIFESAKQIISPTITIWQSHIITISFASIIAPIVSYFAIRKIETLRREAVSELGVRKELEEELQKTQAQLEARVLERTSELMNANANLRQENKIRRETERAFRESEERYKLLFRNSPVGFFHFNSDYILTDFNERFLEIFEADEEKVRNINLSTLNDQNLVPALSEALKGNEGYFEGLYHATTSNAVCYISLKTAPFFDGNSMVKGGIGIVENINERKLAEMTLLEAKEKAEKSDELKSEFLAQISHEIRTPLNSMLNFVNLLHDELYEKVEDDLKPGFEIIDKSGKRIIRTIDLILNMSEIQTGTFEFTSSHVDLYNDVLIELYAEYKDVATKKSLEIAVINEADNTVLKTDAYVLLQIFTHLVDNAVKFTEKGSVKIFICNDNRNRLMVSVRDTGIGMSEKYLSQLFKPFSQEEQGYTRRFEGCGLGLSLVQKYCDLIGAELSVNSIKNIGSSFTVIFPQNMLEE